MKGLNIVVTAGGTSEKIDNVRKITNSSTGKLGVKIVDEILKSKCFKNIYYMCSKDSLKPISKSVKIIEIDGVRDLLEKTKELLQNEVIDVFIHSMAVSDYFVSYVTTPNKLEEEILISDKEIKNIISNPSFYFTEKKISSDEENLVLILKQAPKVISIIKDISPKTYLVGFKLLDGVSKVKLIEVAKKLKDKNSCDLVIANDLANIRNGKHIAYFIDQENNVVEVQSKEGIAKELIKKII